MNSIERILTAINENDNSLLQAEVPRNSIEKLLYYIAIKVNEGSATVGDGYNKDYIDKNFYTKEYLDKYLKVSEFFKDGVYYGYVTDTSEMLNENEVKSKLTKINKFKRDDTITFNVPINAKAIFLLHSYRDCNNYYVTFNDNEANDYEWNDIYIDGVLYGCIHFKFDEGTNEVINVKYNVW